MAALFSPSTLGVVTQPTDSRLSETTVNMGAKCEIAFSIVGMLVGISVFFCFGIVFSNWDCAAWGLVSGTGNWLCMLKF